METSHGWILVGLGLLLLAAYVAHALGARTHVPRVTLLILLGLACGPAGFDIVPDEVSQWFPLVAHATLALVGFLLGERFGEKALRTTGRAVLWISVCVTLITAALVFGALVAAGASIGFALLLGGIAPATAPAATVDIVREARAKGPLTETVLGVVALDDAWGVMLFTLALSVTMAISGAGSAGWQIATGLWEVVGAVALGSLLGLPMAWLTGRLRTEEPLLVEVAGFVLLCGGMATVLGVSYLLACMALGAVVANRARHYSRPFHAIKGVLEPPLAVFFVLAGARFESNSLLELGVMGSVFAIARVAGRVVGGNIGARLAGAPTVVRSRVGWCLLPQAGVSVGLALLAVERVPELGVPILRLVIATTVLFEVIAPIVTRWHLEKARELRAVHGVEN